MANQNNLGIRITADLNRKESIQDINKSLEVIESQVTKLDLGVDFKGFAKEFNKAVNKMDTGNIKEEMQESFDLPVEKIKKQSSVIGKQIKELEKQYGGTVSKVSRNMNFDGDKSEIKDFTVTLEKANKEMKKLKLSPNLDDHNKLDIISTEEVQDVKAARKETEKLTDAMADGREKTNVNKQSEEYKEIKKQSQYINQNLEEQYRNELKLAEQMAQGREKSNVRIRNQNEKLTQNQHEQINKNEKLDRQLEERIAKLKQMSRIRAEKVLTEKKKYMTQGQKDEIDDYIRSVKRINKDTPDAVKQLGRLDMKFKNVRSEIDKVANRTMTFTDRFKEAISASIQWSLALGTLYGAVNSLRTGIEVITDLDTSITNLKKVMDQDTTNFNAMLDDAIVKAKELGQTVTGVLDSFEEGARQGLNAQDINYLSEASLLAANTGEIEAGKSAEYLTAAIAQMKMEYKDSMSIVDSWNEISNNNATSVEKLAAGWSKSAATARNFGANMHEISATVGSLTQVLKQSGNEVGNFVKSAFPRVLMSDVQGQLKEIGINARDGSGELKNALDIYKEVAEAMEQGRLSTEEFNKAALALGGRRHVTRVKISPL